MIPIISSYDIDSCLKNYGRFIKCYNSATKEERKVLSKSYNDIINDRTKNRTTPHNTENKLNNTKVK